MTTCLQRCFVLAALLLGPESFAADLREIDPGELRAALELATTAAGGGQPVHLEILDYTRGPLPQGKLEFQRAGLSPSGVWRGKLVVAPNRSVPVWAKVRASVDARWVESREELPAFQEILPEQLAERQGERSLLDSFAAPVSLASKEEAVGRLATRRIPPGKPLERSMLRQKPEIQRGDTVRVEVTSGLAAIAFDGVAETGGRRGESIVINNPVNGRKLSARVDGIGKVVIRK